MLFIVLVAMSSCSKEDNTSSPTQSLAQMLVGEWIMELPVSGLEADPGSDIVIPDDADMLTLIFHFDADGNGWKELNVMREGKLIYSAINRHETGFTYTIDEEGEVEVFLDTQENSELLQFNGHILTAEFEGVEFYLVRATDDQIQSYKKESDEWHGGSDEGGSIDTDIDNTDAGEPSRSPMQHKSGFRSF